MRKLATICLCIVTSLSFVEGILAQDYSYLLTIRSMGEDEQRFDVQVKSTMGASSEQTIQQITDKITPFEMTLEKGEHEIVVNKTTAKGQIESKIIGVLDGEKKGFASCDNDKATLKAGPQGRCAASGY